MVDDAWVSALGLLFELFGRFGRCAGRWLTRIPAAAVFEFCSQTLALFRRHALPVAGPMAAPAPRAVPTRTAPEAAAEDPAQNEQTDCLPVLQCWPPEQARDERIPQA